MHGAILQQQLFKTATENDAYLAIDNQVPFAGVSTDEEIIEELQAVTMPEPEPEQNSELAPRITKSEASKHLQALKLFLMQSSKDKSEELKILATIERGFEVKSVQSAITAYF